MLRGASWYQAWGGKGSHTRWKHDKVSRTITLSGKDGSDAGPRQEADIKRAVREAETAKQESS
jgi:predicted RNA binding protein YcfA (HicA-like mRNA interferase family)